MNCFESFWLQSWNSWPQEQLWRSPKKVLEICWNDDIDLSMAAVLAPDVLTAQRYEGAAKLERNIRRGVVGSGIETQVCKFTRALFSFHLFGSQMVILFLSLSLKSCLAMLGDACCTMLCRAPRWKKPWLRSDGFLGLAWGTWVKTCGLERLTEKDAQDRHPVIPSSPCSNVFSAGKQYKPFVNPLQT